MPYFCDMTPHFNPILENARVLLRPLENTDFDALFELAADPLIWEQHPHKDRWQEDVFRGFFTASLNSNGAFVIVDKSTNAIIGMTRYYEYDPQQQFVVIGGTFFARAYWGTGMNRQVKELMLDHIFQYLPLVYFYIDRFNLRSQTAIKRLGAIYSHELPMGGDFIDYVYRIRKEDWPNRESASATH